MSLVLASSYQPCLLVLASSYQPCLWFYSRITSLVSGFSLQLPALPWVYTQVTSLSFGFSHQLPVLSLVLVPSYQSCLWVKPSVPSLVFGFSPQFPVTQSILGHQLIFRYPPKNLSFDSRVRKFNISEANYAKDP